MTQSYPHYEINVEDDSIAVPLTVDELPLHRPLYIVKAQQGPIGVPVWCPTFSVARKTFGSETFNALNGTYFSAQAYYLLQTLPFCGAFIIRVADNTAVAASNVLELSVEAVDVPQYQKDGDGYRLVDGNGDFIPEEPAATLPGTELTWGLRPLAELEDKHNIAPVTVTTVTTYPIAVLEAGSPGLYGNDRGVSFSFNLDSNNPSKVDRVGGIFLTMSASAKEYNSSVTSILKDKYGNNSVDFTFLPNAVDPATTQAVSIDAVIEKNYSDGYELPFSIVAYPENIKTIADIVRGLEDATGLILDNPWDINLFTGKDLDNKYYDTVQYGAGSILLSSNVIHYMSGGLDGGITDANVEAMAKQVYELTTNPDIADKARYPFTAVIDHGATLDGKKDMLNFMAVRDDIKVCVGTHDNSIATLDIAADESMAAALNSYALLMKESVIKGTACCRALVFMQAGIPNEGYGSNYLPMTLWYAIKKAEFNNKTYLDRETKGRPNADVDVFKEISWTPNNEDLKARSWDAGANYCQFATMTARHYAGIRTVYPYDSSVLVDDTFTDAVIYAKHEVRESWSIHAGLTIPVKQLQEKMKKDLDERLSEVFNGKYDFDVNIYQTDEEAKLGYIQHVAISIIGPAASRVWIVDVKCKRETAV